MLNRSLILILVLSVFLSSPVAAVEKFDLQYRFRDGQKFIVKREIEVIARSSGNEKRIPIDVITRVTVNHVPAGFQVTVDCLRVISEISRNVKDWNMMGIMNPGQQAVFEMNKRGDVIRYIKQPFNAFNHPFFFVLPQKPVAVGEEWGKSHTANAKELGFVTFRNKVRLERVKGASNGPHAWLTSDLAMRNSAGNMDMKLRMKVDLDLTRGYIIRGKFDLDSILRKDGETTESSVRYTWITEEERPGRKKSERDDF